MAATGDSLSAFTSEQELVPPQPLAPARETPITSKVGAPPPGRGGYVAPGRQAFWARWAVPILVAVASAQTALLAWVWVANGQAWQPRAPSTTPRVTITSQPNGSAVRVDGAPRGVTPVTLTLDAGSHELQVDVEGTVLTQALLVKPGESSAVHVVQSAPAAAPSEPREGAIEITTDPPGLPVAVDGQPRGVSPVAVTNLQPGEHDVTVTRGSTVTRRRVSIEAGVPTTVLLTTGTAGIASGWLTVTAPVPVRILENAMLVGSSETPRLLLTVGRHDLEFANDTFGYRIHRTVQITAGQAASVALEPATGTLSVNAQPWAEVWVDGKRIGETPIGNLTLPIGNHDLMLRHPEFGERRRTVAVSVNTPARIGIDLRQ